MYVEQQIFKINTKTRAAKARASIDAIDTSSPTSGALIQDHSKIINDSINNPHARGYP